MASPSRIGFPRLKIDFFLSGYGSTYNEENTTTSDSEDDNDLTDDDDERQKNPWKLTKEETTNFEEIFPQEPTPKDERPDTKV